MKNLLLLIILLSFVSTIKAEELEKIDMRGMSMSQRIKIMADIRKQNRMKSKTITEQSDEFMSEIRKGSSGLNSAKSKIYGQNVDEINKEAGRETQSSSFSKLQSAMNQEGGEVKKYRQIGSESTLNDNLKKVQYLIEYENGRTQNVELLYIKPTISGGFKLMEVNVTN